MNLTSAFPQPSVLQVYPAADRRPRPPSTCRPAPARHLALVTRRRRWHLRAYNGTPDVIVDVSAGSAQHGRRPRLLRRGRAIAGHRPVPCPPAADVPVVVPPRRWSTSVGGLRRLRSPPGRGAAGVSSLINSAPGETMPTSAPSPPRGRRLRELSLAGTADGPGRVFETRPLTQSAAATGHPGHAQPSATSASASAPARSCGRAITVARSMRRTGAGGERPQQPATGLAVAAVEPGAADPAEPGAVRPRRAMRTCCAEGSAGNRVRGGTPWLRVHQALVHSTPDRWAARVGGAAPPRGQLPPRHRAWDGRCWCPPPRRPLQAKARTATPCTAPRPAAQQASRVGGTVGPTWVAVAAGSAPGGGSRAPATAQHVAEGAAAHAAVVGTWP